MQLLQEKTPHKQRSLLAQLCRIHFLTTYCTIYYHLLSVGVIVCMCCNVSSVGVDVCVCVYLVMFTVCLWYGNAYNANNGLFVVGNRKYTRYVLAKLFLSHFHHTFSMVCLS